MQFDLSLHKKKTSLMDLVNNDELGIIFDYLPLHCFCYIPLVCKRWYNLFQKRIHNVKFWKSLYLKYFHATCSCQSIGPLNSRCDQCNTLFQLKFHHECFCMSHWICCHMNESMMIYPPDIKEPTSVEDWKYLYFDTRLELSWGLPFADVEDPKSNFRCTKLRFKNSQILSMYRNLLERKLKEWEYYNHTHWKKLSSKMRSELALKLSKQFLFAKFIAADMKYETISIQASSDWIYGGVTVFAKFIRSDVKILNWNLFSSSSVKNTIVLKLYEYEVYFDNNGLLTNIKENASIIPELIQLTQKKKGLFHSFNSL